MADDDKPIVLITGAAGRVGRVLSNALSPNYRVIGMDQGGKTADVPLIPVDLTANASVDQALEQLRNGYGAQLASVIHLAAFFRLHG